MSWDTPDVYYNPEKFGLTVVASLEFSDQNYCFDTRVVWKHEDGTLYTARDSGCSCPSPFENYTSLESLEKAHIPDLENEIQSEINAAGEDSFRWGNTNFIRESREFIDKVKAAL